MSCKYSTLIIGEYQYMQTGHVHKTAEIIASYKHGMHVRFIVHYTWHTIIYMLWSRPLTWSEDSPKDPALGPLDGFLGGPVLLEDCAAATPGCGARVWGIRLGPLAIQDPSIIVIGIHLQTNTINRGKCTAVNKKTISNVLITTTKQQISKVLTTL